MIKGGEMVVCVESGGKAERGCWLETSTLNLGLRFDHVQITTPGSSTGVSFVPPSFHSKFGYNQALSTRLLICKVVSASALQTYSS